MDPTGPASFWACMFAFSKIAELGDTVFLVLRKRPVIFLHWYHHAVVLVYCWHSGAFIFLSFFFNFLFSIPQQHCTLCSIYSAPVREINAESIRTRERFTTFW
ncbi:unnamed protein product [Nippostrongylus brasiliensis]|uniref:Elongation of very long chain fatty acids protein n=1 Tax=Nippostrongylus brasiliensis TaxID=27835 RepID=A0A0N4XKS1_NIPBR|nr:unnamed protein product [Nippostrongylus brasiliensis]